MNYLTILQYYEMDETESKRIESKYKLLTDNIFFFPIIFDNPQL